MTNNAAAFNTSDPSAPGHYGPSETALLLLDFHSMFVEKVVGPNGRAASQVAAQTRTWAKSQGIHVIHCLIDVNGTPFPACKDADRFKAAVSAMRSSGGEEPAELVEGSEGEPTFTRRPGYISALKSAGLGEHLTEKGIKSLILTGLSTSGCVMKTAIPATDAEYVVTVLSDACADRQQDVHDMVLGQLLNDRGYVMNANEFRDGYQKAQAAK